MPLETGTTLAQLDANWPNGRDSATRGDDHIRLIKDTLKKQFPGEAGQGFAKPISLTEDFLNGLPDKIKALEDAWKTKFGVGAVVLRFDDLDVNQIYHGTWVRVTGDASLCLGDGSNSVGSIFGENEVVVPVPEHTHGASFSGNPLPAHTHSGVYGGFTFKMADGGGPNNVPYGGGYTSTGATSAGTPSGTVTINNAGTKDVKMNVRGAQIKVNVWKCTGV